MAFVYKQQRLTIKEYTDFLSRCDLKKLFPTSEFEKRIERLVYNSSINLVAYDQEKIVGVLLGLTDYAYWLFVSDLSIDREYVDKGVSKELVKKAHAICGGKKNIAVYVVADENLNGTYETIGMKKAEDVYCIDKVDWK